MSFRRTVGAFLSLIYISVNCLFAHAYEINTLASRTTLKPVVFHIQDVHMNVAAQERISETVQNLIHHRGVRLVALEGAFETLDFSPFTKRFHEEALKKAADVMLKENRMPGGLHAAFCATLSPDVVSLQTVGVDDESA